MWRQTFRDGRAGVLRRALPQSQPPLLAQLLL